MSLFHNIFNKKGINIIELNNQKKDVVNLEKIDSEDEDEIISAITAAITCILEKSSNDFFVRSLKRTPELDSIWSLTGRMKLMR